MRAERFRMRRNLLKNATMKFRFLFSLLLVGCLLPAAACSSDENESPKPDPDTPSKLSERMYVKKRGDDLYISAKVDSRTDIVYWFKRCMFNELYTFYRVGLVGNTSLSPTTAPDAEPATELNRAYSDNIGPLNVTGGGWCGGNHKFREKLGRTAYNESYAVRVDGWKVESDMAAYADRVTITVENVILDPTRPTSVAGTEELRQPLCRESVHYDVFRNNIQVAVTHDFSNTAPVTLKIYYGMQSMFEGETHTFTSGGAYAEWTEQAQVSQFTKGAYPGFRRFVEKNARAFQSTFLLPDGMGDHAFLGTGDVVFIGNSNAKTYHKLIADKRAAAGDKFSWRGVYTWFTAPIEDDGEVLCYEGIVDGRRALFIDCKRACDRTLTLPEELTVDDFEVIDSNGGMRITADGTRTLGLSAGAAAGTVLVLK